jgi:hypothetical protein
MLYDNASVYLNGEVFAGLADHPALMALSPAAVRGGVPKPTLRLLHQVSDGSVACRIFQRILSLNPSRVRRVP